MSLLPTDKQERKRIPIVAGFLKYFPRSVIAVTKVSFTGNEQHNPGQPLHWDRSKSTDDIEALVRHLMSHIAGEELDDDGELHVAKLAWRALAVCEKYLESKVS